MQYSTSPCARGRRYENDYYRYHRRHPMDERSIVITIIDGDPAVRELYSLELSARGYEVVTGDVESAEESIARSKPNLVLLDPYDGSHYRWDVLAEIRRQNVELPILICLPFEMFVNDQDVGPADGCIVKSFEVSGLVSRVQSLLATKGPGRVPVKDER